MDYLWDLSQATSFSQLPDEDFLALLQKQFPTGAAYPGGAGINPQSLNLPQSATLPSLSPASEDSSDSPSPPRGEETHKRKASDDDEFEPGPSNKSQHTAPKKTASGTTNTKRKSSTGADESRLMKRKEQNRAAQRAFRERKEKHVKDLEDKVAELEAKNTQAQSENENLKDLLTRLQNENMALKQSSFTFSVPKAQSPPAQTNIFPSPPYIAQSPYPHRIPTNALDLSSLSSFDPTVLNVFDEPPSATTTATSAGSSMDYGFAAEDNAGFLGNFTTIARNPMFMSLSSYFDEPLSAGPASQVDLSAMALLNASPQLNSSPPSSQPQSKDTLGAFDFDFNNLTAWPANGSSSNTNNSQNFSTDDLFASWGINPPPSTSSISPIVHQASPPNLPNSSSSSGIGLGSNFARAAASESSSSSSSSAGASPESDQMSSATSVSDAGMEDGTQHNSDQCPKTKEQLKDCIEQEGSSPFAPSSNNALVFPNSSNPLNGFPSFPSTFALQAAPKAMTCSSTSHFPTTEKSENNVEVMSAWKTIISDPNHKSVDINLLCSEFSSKARCDGSKVVLKPEGLEDIKKLVSGNQQGGF